MRPERVDCPTIARFNGRLCPIFRRQQCFRLSNENATSNPFMNVHWPVPAIHPPLADGAAHIWAVSLEPASQLDALSAILSPEELQRAAELRLAAPRQRFLTARWTLRILLGRYLGIPPASVTIAVDANNKPRLADAHDQSKLRFNVAHSGECALIAMTLAREIGVDVEQCREVRQAEHIAQRYFHPAEIAALLAATPAERNRAFLRCWTGKEAVLKAIGSGITGSLAAFQVADAQVTVDGAIVDVPTLSAAHHVQCCLRWLDLDDDYLAAAAIVGQQVDFHCMMFRP